MQLTTEIQGYFWSRHYGNGCLLNCDLYFAGGWSYFEAEPLVLEQNAAAELELGAAELLELGAAEAQSYFAPGAACWFYFEPGFGSGYCFCSARLFWPLVLELEVVELP